MSGSRAPPSASKGATAPPETPPPSPMVFTRPEKVRVFLIMAAIAAVTGLGFVAIYRIGAAFPIFIGLGILAWTLGLRHGVDADHICAIDNTTRKLLQQGKRPYTVGTWFSLGHSTIVFGLLVALVVATRWISANIPAFENDGAIIGTAISGLFLYLIALINLLIFLEIYAIFRALRRGKLDNAALEHQLNQRGFMNRYFNFLFKLVNEPWQIYPIGVLFGLGFDTATEVALIAITVTVGAAGFPLWMILSLPLMFTCGMVLTDSWDGIGMRFAYGWAFLKPIRKVYYNLTMTVISVLVAFVIGTVEIIGVVVGEFNLSGGLFGFYDTMNWVNNAEGPDGIEIWGWIGIGIVALFIGCWLVAMLVYKLMRIEELGFGVKSLGPDPSPSASEPRSDPPP